MAVIGPRHIQIATKWMPSAATYGAVGILTFLYISDWKDVMQYVPYVNGKFKE